jgi:hypothetical protein
MPLRVQKRARENPQGLIFRFTKKMKASGIMMEVKKRMFKKRDKSRPLKKRMALKREEKKKEYEKLKKFRKV